MKVVGRPKFRSTPKLEAEKSVGSQQTVYKKMAAIEHIDSGHYYA